MRRAAASGSRCHSAFVVSPREREDERLPLDARASLLDGVAAVAPCGARQRGDGLADSEAVGANRQVLGREHILHLEPVRVPERALEDALGHLEPDEPPVHDRQVLAADRARDIERELDDDVLLRSLRVRHPITELPLQLRIHHRDGPIRGFGMAGVVGRVVRQRAKRKGIFVRVRRLAQKRFDEVARAHVVHQVAEELVAERVIPQILNDRPAVGVGARFVHLCGRRARISLLNQRRHRRRPQDVHQPFVRQDGVSVDREEVTSAQTTVAARMSAARFEAIVPVVAGCPTSSISRVRAVRTVRAAKPERMPFGSVARLVP